jgi:hypothetical protein
MSSYQDDTDVAAKKCTYKQYDDLERIKMRVLLLQKKSRSSFTAAVINIL